MNRSSIDLSSAVEYINSYLSKGMSYTKPELIKIINDGIQRTSYSNKILCCMAKDGILNKIKNEDRSVSWLPTGTELSETELDEYLQEARSGNNKSSNITSKEVYKKLKPLCDMFGIVISLPDTI